MANVITVTSENFDSVINSSKPVLLDFWAEWCGPCKMMSPIVDEIAEERDDVVVGKVNVDDELSLAQSFGITSIPTLLVFKNGEVYNKSVGLQQKTEVLTLFN